MKYFDVVANRRACIWRDVKAISPKPPKYKPQMEQRPAEGHDVIECRDWHETITFCSRCVEEASLRLAVKQSQPVTFGKFFLSLTS